MSEEAPPMAAQPGRGSMAGGIRWMSVNQMVTQFVRVGVQIIMARLLEPRAFGLMTMALVVVMFVEIIRGFGTGMAVVQRREVNDSLLSSVFILNIALGAAVSALLVLIAPLIGLLYGDAALTPILQVLAIGVILASMGDLQQWLLRRDMDFRSVTAAQITGAAGTGVISVVMGVLGFGVWALVVGYVTGFGLISVVAWIQSPWRPRAVFSAAEVRSVLAFSANLSAFRIFNFFLANGDKVIVGRFLGAQQLGYYGVAQQILMYPMSLAVNALNEVMFAGLSRLQDHHPEFRRVYFRSCAVSGMIFFPAMTGLAIAAEDLVLIVLGERWEPLVPLVWILAPIGGLQAVTMTVSVIYNATGRTDLLMRWGMFTGPLMFGSYFVGLPWGVNGVAIAYATVIVLLIPPGFAIPFKLVGARFGELTSAVWPYLAGSLAMAAGMASVQWATHHLGLSRPMCLAATLLAGASVYAGVMLLFRPPALYDLMRFARRRVVAGGSNTSANP